MSRHYHDKDCIPDALERIVDLLEARMLNDEQRDRLAREREDRAFNDSKANIERAAQEALERAR